MRSDYDVIYVSQTDGCLSSQAISSNGNNRDLIAISSSYLVPRKYVICKQNVSISIRLFMLVHSSSIRSDSIHP